MTPTQTIVLYRPLLHTIACNLVKCKEDAEDIVQETFMKWLSLDQKKIENTKAYLIRAVTNNCLNHLSSLRKKKEEYLDHLHLPELLNRFKEINLSKMDLDINLTQAFKMLQAKLEPLERAVYLLKEGFDFNYDELQQALNKKKDHCRQLFCRAKKKLNEETSKIHLSLAEGSSLLKSFKEACDGNATLLVNELKKSIS
ncbi:MAG: sigma-70 family RNA polymerase sigma factor [Bacteroidetes bacterium]|nr:sigma-70 family RNA polymerase sigma factor [Bacteroidota bacterium]